MKMRKITSFVLATVLSCMMGMTAFAAGNSPQTSGYMKIKTATDKNGNAVEVKLAEVADKNLVSEIKKPENFKAVLENAKVEVTGGMEVFDVKEVTVPEGTEFPVTITFNTPGVVETTKVAVLHYEGSAWEVVPSKAGTNIVTATFDSLSPVAIVIDKDTMKPTGSTSDKAPRTGAGMAVPAAMAVAVIAAAGFVAFRKKETR